MCPDPQLLSVYYDDELPSPWKEKMESHLAQCGECRLKLESYSRLSPGAGDKSAPAESQASAMERVWKKLAENAAIAGAPDLENAASGPGNSGLHAYRRKSANAGFWNRKISIPLPAAAAAALFIALAALLVLQTGSQRAVPNMTLASEEYSLWPPMDSGFDTAGMIPVTDLNGVLQYLGARDSGDMVILRLPESRSFMSSGEPSIIKAADYSRRKP